MNVPLKDDTGRERFTAAVVASFLALLLVALGPSSVIATPPGAGDPACGNATVSGAGFWNTFAQNKWATLGPRWIEPGENEGKIVPPGNRTWLATVPSMMESVNLEIRKTNKADVDLLGVEIPLNTRMEVTVCSTNRDGRTKVLHQEDVLAKADVGTVVSESFENPESGILSIYMRSKAKVPFTFKYSIEVENVPRKFDAGGVDGFADLHVHQMADVAYAGLWYWGDHASTEEALRACVPAEERQRRKRMVEKHLGVSPTFYTHAIPAALLPEGHLNIEHGPPAPASLDGWPRYDDIAHQQVNAEWLKQAHENGLDLAVVSTVNFQAVCKAMKWLLSKDEVSADRRCNDLDNVVRQLRAAREMERKYPWYEIAEHPWHARKIIDEGKLAVVLSMEVSNLFPKGRHDFVWQLERLRAMGLSTMQLAHETNSRFAGAAPHKDLFETFEDIKHPFRGEKGFERDADGKNAMGLTSEGKRLVNVLVDRHMPIDLAHLSEKSVRHVHEIAMKHGGFPLYDSHTRLKGILTEKKQKEQEEFLTTCEQATYIEETGGMVGLRTGDTDLLTYLEDGEPVVENTCPGSSRSFAQMVAFAADTTGLDIAFGSDLNGFITQLGPRFGPEACHRASGLERMTYAARQSREYEASDVYHRVGLSHVGYLPDLLADLEGLVGPQDVQQLKSSAEDFLTMWERAWNENRQPREPETTCPGWSGAATRVRTLEETSPEPSRRVDGLLRVGVEGVRGPEATIEDFTTGQSVAGAFLNEVAFEPEPIGRDVSIQSVWLRRAELESDGYVVGDPLRRYEDGSQVTEAGRYALEVYALDGVDHTRVAHVFFRVVPGPDEIRSVVDYDLAGAQSVVSYDWSDDRERFVFTHDRGTEGSGTGQSWTFQGTLTPEATSEDESTVQRFHLRLDGESIENGETFLQGAESGEHTLALYACHNVLAGSCETSAGAAVETGEEKEGRERRHEKKKKKRKRGPEENTGRAYAPQTVPAGMLLIARHVIRLEGGLEIDTPVDVPTDRPPVDVPPTQNPVPQPPTDSGESR